MVLTSFAEGECISLNEQEAILRLNAEVLDTGEHEAVQWDGNFDEHSVELFEIARGEALGQLILVDVAEQLGESIASLPVLMQFRRCWTVVIELGLLDDLG